jgi:hypothetical protein
MWDIVKSTFTNMAVMLNFELMYDKRNLTYLRSRALPERLPIVQPLKEIPSNFKEPEGSSPCSQESSTGPYPELDRWSSYRPILSL